MLRSRDRRMWQEMLRQAPGVFLHHSGHTHRMRVNRRDRGSDHIHFLETAACAAYPGGYTAVRLYTGGYQINFYRPLTDEVMNWLAISRWQSLGIGAHMMIGRFSDRNHVIYTDLSALTPTH